MMYIDDYIGAEKEIDGKYVICRPLNYTSRTLWERFSDAWAVFIGKADAVKFHGQ